MIKRKNAVLAMAAVGLMAAALAPAAMAEVTEAEKTANAEAMELGKRLYQYDQAAWHSTDAMVAALEGRTTTVAGWVVEEPGDGSLLVTYYGDGESERPVVARYVMRDGKVVSGGLGTADDRLSAAAYRMIAARSAAMARAVDEKLGLCTNGNLNHIILPPRDDGTISVYLMSSAVEHGVFPLGGHYRFDIDAAGKVASWRPFLKSCMMIDSRPEGEMAKKTAFYVSHLLDPQPTEIHYFVRYNVPVDMAIIMPDEDVWLLGIDGFTNPESGEVALP